MKLTEYIWGVQTFPRVVAEAQQRLIRSLSDLPEQVADKLGQLKTDFVDPSKPDDYFLAANRHRDHHFRLEVKREFVGYAHKADEPVNMRDHVAEFAPQLLGTLFNFDRDCLDDPRVDLSRGLRRISYQFSTKINCKGSGRLKNREGLCRNLVTGLQQIGIPGNLERVDLRFCLDQLNVTLSSETSSSDLKLWVNIKTPSDSDYQNLEVEFTLQTSESRMPKSW